MTERFSMVIQGKQTDTDVRIPTKEEGEDYIFRVQTIEQKNGEEIAVICKGNYSDSEECRAEILKCRKGEFGCQFMFNTDEYGPIGIRIYFILGYDEVHIVVYY